MVVTIFDQDTGNCIYTNRTRWCLLCTASETVEGLLYFPARVGELDNYDDVSHLSLCFVLRILESLVALDLASCPGIAIMYSSYACWHYMSHDGIRHGLHL